MAVDNLTPVPLNKASDVLADVDDVRHIAQRVVTRLVDLITDVDEHVAKGRAKAGEYDELVARVDAIKLAVADAERQLAEKDAQLKVMEKKYADLKAAVAKVKAAAESF